MPALVSALKSVDLPTLGRPTMPHLRLMALLSFPRARGNDRSAMSLKCGIVGLPNVGKSTLFNALTKAGIAAENYPFCTKIGRASCRVTGWVCEQGVAVNK